MIHYIWMHVTGSESDYMIGFNGNNFDWFVLVLALIWFSIIKFIFGKSWKLTLVEKCYINKQKLTELENESISEWGVFRCNCLDLYESNNLKFVLFLVSKQWGLPCGWSVLHPEPLMFTSSAMRNNRFCCVPAAGIQLAY